MDQLHFLQSSFVFVNVIVDAISRVSYIKACILTSSNTIPFLFLIESSSFHLLEGCVGEKVKNNMFVAGRWNH